MPTRRSLRRRLIISRWWFLLAWCGSVCFCLGQNAVLHLRNGDRISGVILSESTNEIVVTSGILGRVTVPVAQIERRDSLPATAANTPPTAKIVTPPPAITSTNKPAATAEKKAIDASPKKVASTNELWRFLKEWKGEVELGMNLGFSTTDRQTYTGRIRTTHIHPFPSQRSLKNSLDYIATYGRTEGIVSDNRMDGSWKIEYDMGKRFSIYNSVGAGYDEIRHIDLEYDIGPGVGYKWLNRSNLVVKTELGANYQDQRLADDKRKTRYSLRLAEEAFWQASSKLRIDEKIEFFPEVLEFSDYRIRAESNLSYLLRNNLSLKLTLIDLYETDPASHVSNNDLQIRSSIGIRF